MITVVPTDRIYLYCGATDMRRGINSLARMVQQVLALDPHTGAIFCFAQGPYRPRCIIETRIYGSGFYWRRSSTPSSLHIHSKL